jgi:intraflagellar transport protein 56
LYAAKAFDVLDRIDPSPEYSDGKRSSCIGVFKQVVHGDETPESIHAILEMLRVNANQPQVDQILALIRRWARRNKIYVG